MRLPFLHRRQERVARSGQLLVQHDVDVLALFPEPVHGQVVRHPVEPALQLIPRRPACVDHIQQPHKELTRQILGLLRISDQAVQVAIHRFGVLVIDRGQCLWVVCASLFKQFLVLR